MENIAGIIKDKTITLYTEGAIDSSHFLRGYDGKCKNVHGHTWKISIWIKGERSQLDKVGILYDFGNIKKIVNLLDHQILNDIKPFDEYNPTAENIVSFVYGNLKLHNQDLQFKVRIYETAVLKTTYAEMGDWE